jgi:hypothetical protein
MPSVRTNCPDSLSATIASSAQLSHNCDETSKNSWARL